MKKKKVCLVLVILCIVGVCGYIWKAMPQKSTNGTLPIEKSQSQKQSQNVDAAEFLIDRIHTPIRGEVISPKTTAELREWFADSDLNQYVPRVFVDQFPDDFPEIGDKELFSKVISSLILRTNEQTIKERTVLLLLRNKMEKGQEWSEKEKAFFNELVDKYDSKSKKTVPSQLADLLPKVNVIPPLAAVLQAAEATDWGTKNLDSPYEQTGWLDNKTYARIPFRSLIKATDSYAREMNGMPPLTDWRYARMQLKERGYTDLGPRVLRWLNDYKMEDLDYSNKLQVRLEELGDIIPDQLKLSKLLPPFEKGKLIVKGHTFSVELARTPEQKRQGFMFRQTIPEKTGMIFYSDELVPMTVWMKNTFVPLDIVFFDKNLKVAKVIENVPALDETLRSSEVPVKGFIEFPAGTVQQYHIQKGDRLKMPK